MGGLEHRISSVARPSEGAREGWEMQENISVFEKLQRQRMHVQGK
jgi:hypothetical protein